jgi:hypothetical protein
MRMDYGSMAADGGNLSKIDAAEAEAIRRDDPIAATYLRKLIGADELLNGGERYCLWLLNMAPEDLRNSPTLRERVAATRTMRLESKRNETREKADTPHLFIFINQPETPYLAVPRTSSETRRYIPMGLMGPEVIATDAMLMIPNADDYVFGIMHGRPFQVWNATVSGRLESRFRISAEITYNNYPWPDRSPATDGSIESAAKEVLTARAGHFGASLADLYDPLAMPPDLMAAHKMLDAAVLAALR